MDLNMAETSLKNQKSNEGEINSEEQDKISKLPDAILVHILSLLPTKLAAQTGILSKRWKDLWVSVPFLDFDMRLWTNYGDATSTSNSFAKAKIQSFTDFVDRLFAIRDNASIKKFRLACDQIDSNRLCTWLSSAGNAEELELDTWGLEFPWNLFVGNSLVNLKLRGQVLQNIPSSVSLLSLKILRLDLVTYVDDASVEKLLSSCPVLEDLQIHRVHWDNVRNFVIAVPSLKRLNLEFVINEDELYDEDTMEMFDCNLSVDAPNLEYLSLVDYMSNSIQANHMEYVTESHLHVMKILEVDHRTKEQISIYGDNVCGIFRSISNVKSLTIHEFTMTSLCDTVDRRLPIFHNLVHLEITLDGVNGSMLLPTFLEISPKLICLILPQGITRPGLQGFSHEENQLIFYQWKPPENVPECLLFSLKNVEIRGISGEIEEELKLVKYILENAMVLEKMTIWYEQWHIGGGRIADASYLTPAKLDDPLGFRDKLMKWNRGSAACQLDIRMPQVRT